MSDLEIAFWANIFIYCSLSIIFSSLNDWILFDYDEDKMISERGFKFYALVLLGAYKILTYLSVIVYLIFYLFFN